MEPDQTFIAQLVPQGFHILLLRQLLCRVVDHVYHLDATDSGPIT